MVLEFQYSGQGLFTGMAVFYTERAWQNLVRMWHDADQSLDEAFEGVQKSVYALLCQQGNWNTLRETSIE